MEKHKKKTERGRRKSLFEPKCQYEYCKIKFSLQHALNPLSSSFTSYFPLIVHYMRLKMMQRPKKYKVSGEIVNMSLGVYLGAANSNSACNTSNTIPPHFTHTLPVILHCTCLKNMQKPREKERGEHWSSNELFRRKLRINWSVGVMLEERKL